MLLPAVKNDAIIDNMFTINDVSDLTIGYKFKQDVHALDLNICDTGSVSDNCYH